MASLNTKEYTEIKWGYMHTYLYVEKESGSNHQNLGFPLWTVFLPLTACKFGGLTEELRVSGQSPPMYNPMLGKLPMMLLYRRHGEDPLLFPTPSSVAVRSSAPCIATESKANGRYHYITTGYSWHFKNIIRPTEQ